MTPQAVQIIHNISNCQSQDETEQIIEAYTIRKTKKKRTKATATVGDKTAPRGISEALRNCDREEAFKWLASINKEWDGLNDMGVLKHDLTKEDLIEMGITTNPIPFSICLDYKFNDTGQIDRYKTRFALAGHPGNMQKGVHYDKTYAATPNQQSARILQAIMIRYGMKRLAFDITMAYCNAKLPPDQAVAVRYPNGFRRYKKVNGMSVELYMAVILRSCRRTVQFRWIFSGTDY